MTSERQITANWRNGLRSTGPRTPTRKLVAAGNGLRHGILAGGAVLPGSSRWSCEREFEQGGPEPVHGELAVEPEQPPEPAYLATAFYEMGEMGRALAYQDQALANWPLVWAGWTTNQWSWFHRCERVFQQLVQHREDEQRASAGRVGSVSTIDPLFPRFHLPAVAKYQAGPLPLLAEDLPSDARETVAQLRIWLPFDDRLTWLYAELSNVSGDIDGAYRLMDELVFTRDWSNVADLKRHKQILRLAIDRRQAVTPDCLTKLFWSLAPRGVGAGVPILGQAATEYGWAASDQFARMPRGEGLPSQGAATNSTPSGSANPILSEREGWYLGIGFGTGVLVTLLGVLQGRQWLRRRDKAKAAAA